MPHSSMRAIAISREKAFSRGFDGVYLFNDYDVRTARKLLTAYPNHHIVDITTPLWNDSTVRYDAEPGHIIYVKSRNGKKTKIRLGAI